VCDLEGKGWRTLEGKVRYRFKMLQEIERLDPECTRFRRFHLFPQHRVRRRFITLTNTIVQELEDLHRERFKVPHWNKTDVLTASVEDLTRVFRVVRGSLNTPRTLDVKFCGKSTDWRDLGATKRSLYGVKWGDVELEAVRPEPARLDTVFDMRLLESGKWRQAGAKRNGKETGNGAGGIVRTDPVLQNTLHDTGFAGGKVLWVPLGPLLHVLVRYGDLLIAELPHAAGEPRRVGLYHPVVLTVTGPEYRPKIGHLMLRQRLLVEHLKPCEEVLCTLISLLTKPTT
jgi:hypothetical protein